MRTTIGWMAVAVMLSAGWAQAASVINLGDFANPTVLDFEGLPAGPISGTGSYFTSVGINSVSVVGGTSAGDVLDTNVDGNALASVNGGLSVAAPGGPIDNGASAGSPAFTIEFADVRDKFGVMVGDQTGVFQLTFKHLGGTVDTFTWNTNLDPFAYVQANPFDTVVVNHPGFTGGYAIDNLTFEGSSIPAPGAIVLGVAGTALVGWLRRRGAI